MNFQCTRIPFLFATVLLFIFAWLKQAGNLLWLPTSCPPLLRLSSLPLPYQTSTSPPFRSTAVWTWRCLLVWLTALLCGQKEEKEEEYWNLFVGCFLLLALPCFQHQNRNKKKITVCLSIPFLRITAHFPNNTSIKQYWIFWRHNNIECILRTNQVQNDY